MRDFIFIDIAVIKQNCFQDVLYWINLLLEGAGERSEQGTPGIYIDTIR